MKVTHFLSWERETCCVFRGSYQSIRNTQHATHGSWFSLAFLLSIFLLLTLTACGSNASAEPIPPTIHYGEDICEFCNMIINEERHAAAYLTKDGQGHIFDEVGNMLQGFLKHQDISDITAFFVHDYEQQNWLRAETAYYVLSPELSTPMGSGLVALASSDQAKALATEVQGQVFTFEEILAYYQENPYIANSGEHHLHTH